MEATFDSIKVWVICSASLVGMASWLTHVITCLSEDKMGFLIAGAVCFPIAIVHGVGIWLGVWH